MEPQLDPAVRKDETLYVMSRTQLLEIREAVGLILRPTVAYDSDHCAMAESVIAQNKIQAQKIRDLLPENL